MKIYSTEGKILTEQPQIQIGDKLYAVDTRKSTFDKMNQEIQKDDMPESDVIIKYTLGDKALAEIRKLDLSIAGVLNLTTYIYAAMFGITFEEATARFQKSAKA